MPPKAGKSDAKAAAEPKAKDALTFLSQRELKVLAECLLTVPGFPDGMTIDPKKAANRLGLASGSVTNSWYAIKKKIIAEKVAAGYITAPGEGNNNGDDAAAAAAEDPNPAPKKRARTAKAAAAAAGDGDAAAAPKRKRAPRAKKAAATAAATAGGAVRGRVPVNPESIMAPVVAPVVGQDEGARAEEDGAEEGASADKQDEGDTTVDENGAESGEAGDI